MVRFRSFVSGLVVAGLFVTGVAFAQGPRGGRPGGPGRGGLGPDGLPLAQLNLSEAQQTQVKEIRERHRNEISTAMAALAAARESMTTEVFSVLTPEQQAQVTKLRAEREARAQERRQQ